MEVLNHDRYWKESPHKGRNMINAFSLAYKAELFGTATIGDIAAGSAPQPEQRQEALHLQEVCFNTTDFYNGLLFRQNCKMQPDSKPDPKFRYGNSRFYVETNTATWFRLADILAASSCFPGGFEPITFPTDFTYTYNGGEVTSTQLLQGTRIGLQELDWTELECLYGTDVRKNPPPFDPGNLESVARAFSALPFEPELKIGFMDGGITDNQGVESMIDAQQRRLRGETDFPAFDLMLVNDVGSHFMSPYKVQQPSEHYTGLLGWSIRGVLIASGLLAALAVAACFYIGAQPWSQAWQILPALVLFMCLPVVGGLLFLRRYLSGKTRKGAGLDLDKTFSPEIVHQLLHHFGSTPLGVLKVMLQARFNSIMTLNSDVFLKRIRYLLYQQLDDGFPEQSVKANHVYDLSFSNDVQRQGDCWQTPLSESLQSVAQRAFEMGTTLWFDKEADKQMAMPALIACGHFTTCYNLIEHIARMKQPKPGGSYYEQLPIDARAQVDTLEAQLKQHFVLFNEDPFWLYNEQSKGLKGYTPPRLADFRLPADFEGLRRSAQPAQKTAPQSIG